MPKRLLTTLLLATVVAAGATPANAGLAKKQTNKAVYASCSKPAKLKKKFKKKTLRRALKHLPTDVAAYSDCEPNITAAIKYRKRHHLK